MVIILTDRHTNLSWFQSVPHSLVLLYPPLLAFPLLFILFQLVSSTFSYIFRLLSRSIPFYLAFISLPHPILFLFCPPYTPHLCLSSLLPPRLAFESFRIIALGRSPLLGALSSFGCYLHTQRALTTLKSVCNLTRRHALTPTHTSVKVNGVVHAQLDQSHAESYLLCTNQWPCRCVRLYLTFFPVKHSKSQSITIPHKDK